MVFEQGCIPLKNRLYVIWPYFMYSITILQNNFKFDIFMFSNLISAIAIKKINCKAREAKQHNILSFRLYTVVWQIRFMLILNFTKKPISFCTTQNRNKSNFKLWHCHQKPKPSPLSHLHRKHFCSIILYNGRVSEKGKVPENARV